MNQERIGKLILKIRKDNNLTQKEFADKFGVTYQAVSKWENGKNIPDIAILKDICNTFNIDINEFLDIDTKKEKKENKNYIIPILLIIVAVIAIIFIQINYVKSDSFEFKTLESNCDSFNISGSIAYNSNISSIFISDVKYCGIPNNSVYDKIECSLYEVENNKQIKIDDCIYENNKNITLTDFLEDVRFNVSNYSSMCKEYSHNSLQLVINANKNNINTTYKIPIELKDNCK